VAHGLRTVDDRFRHAGVLASECEVRAAQRPAVAVASRLAEHRDRDLHARALDPAALDRGLHSEVGAGGVPNRGHALAQRRFEVVHGVVEAGRERRVEPAGDIHQVGTEHHMGVAVEEPRQHVLAGHVDALVAVELRCDVDDLAVLDEHVGGRSCRARSVEHHPAVEHGPRHEADAIAHTFLISPSRSTHT
jgi:hypothetical protein